jgi:hypothetical protein
VVEEPARGAERQLGLEAQQVVALQPRQDRLDGDGRGHEPEQRPDDPFLAADQVVVDEDAREGRDDQARDDQQQAADHHVEERALGPDQAPAQRRQHVGGLAAFLELGALGEGQHDPRIGAVELGHRDFPRPLRRIVQVGLALAEPLQHHEVVEVPEQDDREGQRVELLDLLVLVALGVEPVLARGAQHVAGLAAVTRDAALVAQLFERDPAAEVGEDLRQRRRAALDRLHLQDGRRLDALARRRRDGLGLLGLDDGVVRHVSRSSIRD